MYSQVCSFNNRFLTLIQVPRSFKFDKSYVNHITFRQSNNLYPNFLQIISTALEQLYKQYNIVAILYNEDTIIMHNFPNGTQKHITYYVYYTTMDDCLIDNIFYDELLEHLVTNVKLSYYESQVFLQSLRQGFNKPDTRIQNIIESFKLKTRSDNLNEIRSRILNLNVQQKNQIQKLVAKNSTFNSILPNMLLLNVTNCIQQESLSIKHANSKTDKNASSLNGGCGGTMKNSPNKIICDMEEYNNNDESDHDLEMKIQTTNNTQQMFKSYIHENDFQQHVYYCSYGEVKIIETHINVSTFNNLITRNIICGFYVKTIKIDQMHVFLYVNIDKFSIFSKIRIHGKILQYTIHGNYNINPQKQLISYEIDFKIPKFYSTAPLIIANTNFVKDSFKPKVKIIQLYLIVCPRILHKILHEWICVCKINRIITSPYYGNIFYHILLYINDADTSFIYDFLPDNGVNVTACRCYSDTSRTFDNTKIPHSQKLWQTRPCVEILFHTHFDWTIMKIHDDFVRKSYATNIFQLYDIFETGKNKIATLLESKIFKVSIENLTTFKFFQETGILYPFEVSGHEELYIYTLIKMTRIVYRCIVLPLIKIEKLSVKNLISSKFALSYIFIDDPLTPTTSVRGPQSTRNLKSVENVENFFDTKVINVTMLMNSFNLCGSDNIKNQIKL